MANGGARPGSGRKRGQKNRKTKLLIEAATKDGITPLEYMMKVMRDENSPLNRRDDMAKAAAPYVHPKLNAISAPNGGPVQVSLSVSFVE